MPERLNEWIGIWIAILIVSSWIALAAFVGLGAVLLIRSAFWAYILPPAAEEIVGMLFRAGLWICGLVSFGLGIFMGVQIWRSPWP